jgi:hypothetical protein
MCPNGWGGKLHDTLVAYLSSERPDVLCLQELALPDHVAVFCPAARGVLWDGDEVIPSQWGLATFVHKSLPVVAQAQGFVHRSFSPHGFGDHPRSRSAHAVRVYDYARDRPVSIAQMHGLRDLGGKIDTPERAAQRVACWTSRIGSPNPAISGSSAAISTSNRTARRWRSSGGVASPSW